MQIGYPHFCPWFSLVQRIEDEIYLLQIWAVSELRTIHIE